MTFIKKVLVLKRTDCSASSSLSGIARLEEENGITEFHLSLVNLTASGGEYFSLIIDGSGKKYFFPLGVRPLSFFKTIEPCPNIASGFCVGIYSVKNDIPVTLAFARSDDKSPTLSEFKKTVADKCLEERKFTSKKPLIEPTITPTQSFMESNDYNDEAVATENYYEFDESINDKLKTIKETLDGNLRFENELPIDRCKEKATQELKQAYCSKNETDASQRKKCEQNGDYQRVKRELDGVFKKFPAYTDLNKIFSDSTWAKINYSDEKYYVVGLIKEDGAEKYVCYGVPAPYSPTPPKALEGFCSFIPRSIFNLKGDGYWMMFQDAQSGKCIKPIE